MIYTHFENLSLLQNQPKIKQVGTVELIGNSDKRAYLHMIYAHFENLILLQNQPKIKQVGTVELIENSDKKGIEWTYMHGNWE